MKIIVIDDEKAMLLIMKKIIAKMEQVEVKGLFLRCKDAELFMKTNTVDLVFLDISMPGENGFEFAEYILEQMPGIKIVFITSHKEYAIEAFSICAFDYIVKPITKQRVLKTISRARECKLDRELLEDDKKNDKLFVYCLGGVDVHGINGENIHFLSSKSEELFIYLIVNREKTMNKWKVIDDIFPDMPKNNAETYLNTTVYKLRKALRAYGMGEAILTLNGGYRIETREIYIDFVDFENRIITIGSIEISILETLIEVEEIYVGELCEHKGYHWLHIEKERILKVYWHFAMELCNRLIGEMQYYSVLKILKKLENINELDEDINILYLHLYAERKDKKALITQYEKYKKLLKDELDMKPEPYIESLYNRFISTFHNIS